MTPVGHLQAIWRYPVKSLLGEQLATAELTLDGIPGDRGFGVMDPAERRVLGAKRHPPLLRAGARTHDGGVTVTMPGGATFTPGEPGLNDALSELLDRRVEVVAMPGGDARTEIETDESTYLSRAGDFHDASPVLLVTTSTLAFLTERYPEGWFDPRRFRPNLVLGTEGASELEQTWIGSTLRIGEARLLVTRTCLRCAVTTLPQEDLELDRGILRTVAQHAGNRTGVYADVTTPGTVNSGDEVILET